MTKWAYFRYAKLVQKLVNVINHIDDLKEKKKVMISDAEITVDKE